MVSPYYYGQYRWDNYLQDLQRNQETSIGFEEKRAHTNEGMVEAAGQQLGELRDQTQRLRNINETLEKGFEEMRAEFNWGFTLMVERLDQQIDALSKIAARLDKIHKTLESPLMTQARELFQIGQDRFKKGLWDKALEAYLMAEQKNDVDFPLQLQIGKLYLYGNNGDLSLVDVAKADKHLAFAARIADAEKDSLPDWSRHCGEAHFHAAVAAYLFGEQEQDTEQSGRRKCLERALAHLAKAISLWPRFTESIYLQAKCQSLLGQQKQALDALAILSDRDRRYYAKALKDGDFGLIRPSVEEVFRNAIAAPGRLAKSTQDVLEKAFGVLQWARRSKPDQSTDKSKIEASADSLDKGQGALRTLDVDIEGLHEEAVRTLRDLDGTTTRVFRVRVEAVKAQIQEAESKRASCRTQIEYLRREMGKTIGSGRTGCSYSFAFVFALCVFVSIAIREPWGRELFAISPLVFGSALLVMIIAGYGVGSRISKTNQNKSKQQMVEENIHAAEECEPLIAKLRQEESKADAEFQPYLQWRHDNGID